MTHHADRDLFLHHPAARRVEQQHPLLFVCLAHARLPLAPHVHDWVLPRALRAPQRVRVVVVPRVHGHIRREILHAQAPLREDPAAHVGANDVNVAEDR